MNSFMIKTEEHDFLHLVFHFTVPLRTKLSWGGGGQGGGMGVIYDWDKI